MKQFDANGVDVDARPADAYQGGVYCGGIFGRTTRHVSRWFENKITSTLTPVSDDWRKAHNYDNGKQGDRR